MPDFRKLQVWQKAHALSFRSDELAAGIRPKRPHLASQMERAADSIAALIAEGRAADTDKEVARFVTMAIKSTSECENHIEKACGAHLISTPRYQSHITDAVEVRRMLIGLRKRL